MTGGGRWTSSQNFKSLAPTVLESMSFEDLEENYDCLSKRLNHDGVWKTAPATPGLLKSQRRRKNYVDPSGKTPHFYKVHLFAKPSNLYFCLFHIFACQNSRSYFYNIFSNACIAPTLPSFCGFHSVVRRSHSFHTSPCTTATMYYNHTLVIQSHLFNPILKQGYKGL